MAGRNINNEKIYDTADSSGILFIMRVRSDKYRRKAGRIQSADLTQENGEDVLDITTKEGRCLRIYLSSGDNPEAIKDISTGEWLVTSSR